MIRRIKKAFVDNMPNLKWMDSKTRVAAVSKVSIKVFHTVFFTNIASFIIAIWTAMFSSKQLAQFV